MPKKFTPEFKRDVVRVARRGDLTRAEVAARLFSVSPKSVDRWVRLGVPSGRARAVGDLAAATDLLDRYLRRDGIPAVVRRPFDAGSRRSLLELAADDPAEVLTQVRAMFDFANILELSGPPPTSTP